MTAAASEDLRAPDFAEPLEAWRAWTVVADANGYSLRSVVRRTLWPAGQPLVAECLRLPRLLARLRRKHRGAGTVPDIECECGIYGAARPGAIRPYLREVPGRRIVAQVFGRVSLWGTVLECEQGYRASHAYPLRIYVPLDAPRPRRLRCEELAAGLEPYVVPVELLPARGAEAIELVEQKLPSR